MISLNIYLTFNGNCAEAFNFYKSVFGGEFAFVGKFSDMPPSEHTTALTQEDANKIMHITLPINNGVCLMGSDTTTQWSLGFVQGNNFSISIQAESTDQADFLFANLSAQGKITMPMANTFWGSYFGMFTDKFGINWMINYDLQQYGNA